MTDNMKAGKRFPNPFGLLLYPQFEVLDAAGPIEILNCLNRGNGFHDMTLSVISQTLDPVTPGPIAPDTVGKDFQGAQLYVPIHTLANAPDLETLMVPGGFGSFDPTKLDAYVKFIADRYHGKDGHSPLTYIISVCNGAGFLAASGISDGKKAMTNKDYFKEVAFVWTEDSVAGKSSVGDGWQYLDHVWCECWG